MAAAKTIFICLVLAVGLAGAPQQRELPSDCAADGTVVNSRTGQPLPRANVTPNSTNGSGTSTDAEGKWVISNINCGPVVFTAEKDGYIQSVYGRPAASAAGGAVKPVVLASGSAAHNLKIELMPEAAIVGRVADDAGDPSAGAQVRIVRSMVQNGRRVTVSGAVTTTDNNGNYRLGGLDAGRYFFCATSNRVRYPVGGGSPTMYGESCFPGPVTGASGTGLQVEGGQEVHADFTLSQVTGAHVRGTLVGAPQTQPAGAMTSGPNPPDPTAIVQMFRTDMNGTIAPGAIAPQRVRNGMFDFPKVTPGSYILRASVPFERGTLAADAFIEVGSTDLDGVSLVLQAGTTVSGTLKIEDVSMGGAHPETGQPINVNLNSVGVSLGTGRIQWDAEHRSFLIPEVLSGKYRINVSAPGAGYYVKSLRLHEREIRNDGFTVSGPTGPIEIVVSNDSGTLQGTVTDTDGNPVASQIILQYGDGLVIVGRSMEDGAVKIQNVPAGSYKAWAFDDGRNVEYADDEWMRRNAGSGADVTITGGSTVQISLVRRVVSQ